MCHNTLPQPTSRPDQPPASHPSGSSSLGQPIPDQPPCNVSQFKPHPQATRSTFGPIPRHPPINTISSHHSSNSGAHTQTRIPARDMWAGIIQGSLSNICDSPSNWSALFMLAKCILASPSQGHRLRWRDILNLVWVAGETVTMNPYGKKQLVQSLSKRLQSPPANPRNVIRAKQAAQDGLYSKAIQALNSTGLAPLSDVVFQEMLTKHYYTPRPCPATRHLARSDNFEKCEVLPQRLSPTQPSVGSCVLPPC